MNQGFVKLYRSILSDPVWMCTTCGQKTVLVTLLMLANYEDSEWYWEGKKFTLRAGQFLTSLKSLSDKCGEGVSISVVRRTIVKLEKMGFLAHQPSQSGTIITICNWDKYQSNEMTADTPMSTPQAQGEHTPDTEQAHKQHTLSTPQARNKNIKKNKNDKKEEKDIGSVSDLSSSAQETGIAQAPQPESKFNFNSIANHYHSTCPALPRILNMDNTRKAAIRARLKEHGRENLLKMFTLAGQSAFLNGDNDKNWMANFDWLLKPANFIKVLEGNYNNERNHLRYNPFKSNHA